MEILKKIILLTLFIIFTSCGSLKDGFINQKKNNNDEFLVEKKSPLIMPPDYNELPTPNTETSEVEKEENSIKTLVTNEDSVADKSNVKNFESKGIEESLLEKIKSN